MKTLLFLVSALLLATRLAGAQDAPPPCPAVIADCSDGAMDCGPHVCVDDSGCTHTRRTHVQDCRDTGSGRPNYCPPGTSTRNPILTFDRRVCTR